SLMSKLRVIKYTEWEKSMYRHLMSVSGSWIARRLGICSQIEKTNPEFYKAVNASQIYSNKAAGEIYQWLDEGNKIHVASIRDDPAAMWEKLKEVHSKSALNAHFNSLSNIFDVQLCDDKMLTALCTCIEGAMQCIKALHPPLIVGPSGLTSPGYTLEMLNNKLTTMAMLCALPHKEYSPCILSVLMLNSLTKDAILEAFQTEETQHHAA
ncbi:hypothetical protein J132_10270, partial [Termitomyces sp. J132]